MQPTHFLYLAIPPRPDFVHQRTPQEQAIMERHFAYMDGLKQQGVVAMTGVSLDGAFGMAMLAVASAAEAQAIVDADPAVATGLVSAKLHPLRIGYWQKD